MMPELKPCRKAFGLDRHNSFFNGCSRWPKDTKDEDYDWQGAWIDNGPSPAGNDGPYVKLPYRPDDTIHRIYPKQSAWRVFAKAVATAMTRPDGGDSLREALQACRDELWHLIGLRSQAITKADLALAAKDGE